MSWSFEDILKTLLALAIVAGIGWGIRWTWTTAVPEYQCDRARERLADAQMILNAILNMMPNIDALKQTEVWDHQRLHDEYVAACGSLATKYRTEREK